MNILNFFKKASLSITALVVALSISSSAVSAIAYNGDNTVASPTPAFNVFTGAPTAGNEADFLRARTIVNETDTNGYVDPLTSACANGQKIQMRVYVHNGASASANGTNGDGPSVAHGTKVSVALPTAEASSFSPTATISSTNAGTVNDGASINCGGKIVKMKYIAGSASAYSKGTGVVRLSDAIVGNGVSIKSQNNVPDGDVLGCWDDRVYVVLSVQVEEIVTPPVVTATCDMFGIAVDKDRKVTVNQFKYTNTNSSVKNVVVNWGDDSANFSTTNAGSVVGQTHQYSTTKDATYNITAVVTFAVADKPDVVSGGAGTACVQKVVFTSAKPPVVTTVTPTTPTTLVNTGPGSVAAIFAAVTAAGAVAHRWYLGRRLDA